MSGHFGHLGFNPKDLINETIWERYKLIRYIGCGASGAVFEAEKQMEGSSLQVALKLIPVNRSTDPNRVVKEIKTQVASAHEHVIRIGDAGKLTLPKVGEVLCIECELAEQSLREQLKRGHIEFETALAICRHVATALAFFHELNPQPVAHLDIKPENILKVGDRWKVSDFGLARFTVNTLTRAATAFVGTEGYIAPEAGFGHVGPKSDLWSLGVVVHECCTGRLPSDGEGNLDIWEGLPEPLATIIMRALVWEPRNRCTSRDILAMLDGEVISVGSLVPPARSQNGNEKLDVTRFVTVAEEGETFREICDAVECAEPGSTIFVRPGTYHKQVIIDKPLTLLCPSEGTSIAELVVRGTPVRVTANDVCIRGLSVVLAASDVNIPAIDCNATGLHIWECDIVGTCGIGVHCYGEEASVLVRDSTISGFSVGVRFSEHGTGLLEDSRVSSCRDVGVEILQGSDPELLRTIIRQCMYGIKISQNGKGKIRDCTVVDSLSRGIHLENTGQPTFYKCIISGSKEINVLVERGGNGTFEQCNLADSATVSVMLAKTSDAYFLRCKFSKSRIAIRAMNGASGSVVRCAFGDDVGKKIAIEDGAATQVID